MSGKGKIWRLWSHERFKGFRVSSSIGAQRRANRWLWGRLLDTGLADHRQDNVLRSGRSSAGEKLVILAHRENRSPKD
jgi:hypothetical protein